MANSIFGLFDLGFAVGYFLPSLLFVLATTSLGRSFEVLPSFLRFDLSSEFGLLYATTITVLIAWLCGILLVAINIDIIRIMEGYGRFNPAYLIKDFEIKYFDEINNAYEKLSEKENPSGYKRILAQRFPHKRSLLLPTAFGNIIRSFETYSNAMYGFDAIPGWDRISFIIPKESREIINSAKSILDFWVNVWALCIVFLVEYFLFAIYSHKCAAPWRFSLSSNCLNIVYSLVLVAIFLTARSRARSAASRWGSLIKAAIDVYLPDLLEKLRFKKPESRAEEFEMWKNYNIAIIYRDPDFLPERERVSDGKQDD